MVFHGLSWPSMVLHDYPWLSMALNGLLWCFMALQGLKGVPWPSLFHENPCPFVLFHGPQ